ncbi:MAG: hypothetical protein IT371_27750 [Deltaproteobacteria bacterium]|nr:hypothetical protein [Deltaproteobacteria bacterium]
MFRGRALDLPRHQGFVWLLLAALAGGCAGKSNLYDATPLADWSCGNSPCPPVPDAGISDRGPARDGAGPGGDGASSGRVYYVDCTAGLDTRDGRSPSSAIKTLGKANSLPLTAGDRLLLRRACTFAGPLLAKWTGTAARPVVVGAFGTGDRPRIVNGDSDGLVVVVTGSYQAFEDLDVTADAPPDSRPNCPTGWRVGFAFNAGAYNTMRNCRASRLTVGALVATGSHHNRILNSQLTDNVNMSQNTQGGEDDSGAWGVLINGDDNEVAFNTFSGNAAFCSYDFGQDGSSVEIYGGRRNVVHHNTATQEVVFAEVGWDAGKVSADNVIVYNLVSNTKDQRALFLAVRSADPAGTSVAARVLNNTAYLTGTEAEALLCPRCNPKLLEARNNILWGNWKSLYAPGGCTESHNIYWRTGGTPTVDAGGTTIAATSKKIDPLLANAAGGNFAPKAGSPAIDTGSTAAIQAGYTSDVKGTTVPVGAGVDIGAIEFTP